MLRVAMRLSTLVRRGALAVVIAGGQGAAASAQVPLGADFRVDVNGASLPNDGNGLPRALAAAPDGGFVAAWRTPAGAIAGRRYSAAGGPIGAEFQISSTASGSRSGERIASDSAGNFVVVWKDSSPASIMGRRFSSAGLPLGPEFEVNSSTGYAFRPAVAMSPSGEFVAVWSHPANPVQDVRGRLFDASGAPVGPDFLIDTSAITHAGDAAVDTDASGNFVVAWGDLTNLDVRAQRFDPAGIRLGAEIVVATDLAVAPHVASWPDGRFVVAWVGDDGDGGGIRARPFAVDGQPVGAEFRVNAHTTSFQRMPSVDVDSQGRPVFVWASVGQDGSGDGVFARIFDSVGGPGPEFQINTGTMGEQVRPGVITDDRGGFVVAWFSQSSPQNVDGEMRARRYGLALTPHGLAADTVALPTSDGNFVFEPGETVAIEPSWRNVNLAPQAFTGTAVSFTGPGTSGNPTYSIADGGASYGSVGSGDTGSCAATGDCYALGISIPTVRPAVHWDAQFREEIVPASLAASKVWDLHVGDSFSEVARANPFYRFVETLLHRGVTGGCSTTTYCPAASTTRSQMAVFVLVAKEGSAYSPPACTTPVFGDVPASSPFCRWIEELARRGVAGGCGAGNYCPSGNVTREQMSVFVLRTLDPALAPPACAVPMFNDVPPTSPFCRWIEELARRGVVTGCGGGSYCPAGPVTRDQMSVFLSVTFGLALYGP